MLSDKQISQNPTQPQKINTQQIISPEAYDELVTIVNFDNWFPIISYGSLILLTLGWSIFGEIPVKVSGRAVLIYPDKVVNVESSITGKIENIQVKPGDCIKAGQVLAVIDSSEIKQKLKQEQFKLQQLSTQHKQLTNLENRRTQIENNLFKQQQVLKYKNIKDGETIIPILNDSKVATIKYKKSSIKQKIRDILKITPELKNKELQELVKQRNSLVKQIRDSKKINPILKDRFKKRSLLFKQGALSKDQVLQSEQEYLQNSQKISELQANLQGLEVTKTKIKQKHQDSLNQIQVYQTELKELELQEIEMKRKNEESLMNVSQIKSELQELEIRQKNLIIENEKLFSNRQNQIHQTRNNIDNLTKEYNTTRELKSEADGCLLEITASPGGILQKGQRFGSMEIKGNHDKIATVSYFSVGDGKKIKPGMKVQVTPDTVSRQRFGGIVGKITEVSPFPITKSAASRVVGNSEIIEYLTQGSSQNTALIQVKAKLITDTSTFSGYKWSSSKGPQLKVTTGTTAAVQAVVEKRRPITYVLPILKEWSGVN